MRYNRRFGRNDLWFGFWWR